MGRPKLPRLLARAGVVFGIGLAVVVVLAAMPGHRQRVEEGAGRSGIQAAPKGNSFPATNIHRENEPRGTRNQVSPEDHMTGMDHDHNQNEAAAVSSMAPGHHHNGLHMRMTAIRAPMPGDEERAEKVVASLRTSIEMYKDYHAALAAGYKPFLPNLPQKEYHFTNNWHGFLEAFTFDAARPTSLLYKKTSDGYELAGAMFTMPKNASEDQLDARVPLSVASWHLHTNLCMPRKGQEKSSDWTKFGLAGSIATPESCTEAGGRFFPSIFGWMVHVYPYEYSQDKVFGRM